MIMGANIRDEPTPSGSARASLPSRSLVTYKHYCTGTVVHASEKAFLLGSIMSPLFLLLCEPVLGREID
jgi:hypothetical protein